MTIPSMHTVFHRAPISFGLLSVFALLLCSTAGANQATQSPDELERKPAPTGPTLFLHQNGFFRSLRGYYFLEKDRLHAYRALRSTLNPQSGKLETVPENDDQRPLWKGEPYYHEIYHLKNGEWMPKAWGPAQLKDRSFSQVPKQYMNFGGCDKKDLINLNRPEIKANLPASAKIKKVAQYGEYAFVVYTDSPAIRPIVKHRGWPRARLSRPPPKPTDRAVHVVMLRREKGKQNTWGPTYQKNTSAIPAYFCGAREVPMTVDGKALQNLLVFSQQGEFAIGNGYTLFEAGPAKSIATK
jgi:hypothetical protein